MRFIKTLFRGLGFAAVVITRTYAVDGQVNINQATALAGGITSSDAPGFPVTIDVSGSYYLTSDLMVPDLSTSAIVVTGDDVSIDLNGFSVIGTNDCSDINWGPGHGIDSYIGNNTTVINGTVRGMGYRGIQGATHVERMRILCNGAEAISVMKRHALIVNNNIQGFIASAGLGERAIVSNNIVTDGSIRVTGIIKDNVVINGNINMRGIGGVVAYNDVSGPAEFYGSGISVNVAGTIVGNSVKNSANRGISAGNASIIKDNVAWNSRLLGISCGDNCMVIGNAATRNGTSNVDRGITTGAGSVLKDNTSVENRSDGIHCDSSCTVVGNTAIENGSSTWPAHGIYAGSSTLIKDNVARGNTGNGIDCGAHCSILGNMSGPNKGYGFRSPGETSYGWNTLLGNLKGAFYGNTKKKELGPNLCGPYPASTNKCPYLQ